MADGREHFSGTVATAMAMIGSAIGLGNIWRFPYMVGQNGGAAFIIVYFLASIFLALPIFFSEAVIGRFTGSGTFGAIRKISPGGKWKLISLLTIISPFIILSYYCVVGGWSMNFLLASIVYGFNPENTAYFSTFISSPVRPLVFHVLFLLATAFIVKAGVKSGIEKFNKLSLPVLFVLIIAIMVYSLSLDGASDGVRYLLKPDFSKLNGRSVVSAIGQSFFSLSLGVGTVLTYSSYMKKDSNLMKTGFGTAFFDLAFALIAGFAVMPAVFAGGIEPSSGPGLIFETLPFVFSSLGADAPVLGRIISTLFFATIAVAAVTSSISMFEVETAFLTEEKKMSRKGAVWLVFAAAWVLGALCSLSFGPLSDFKIAGQTLFSFCDLLTSNFLMMLGGLLFVIFTGWIMKKSDVFNELYSGSMLHTHPWLANLLYVFIRYVSPFTILAVCVSNAFS